MTPEQKEAKRIRSVVNEWTDPVEIARIPLKVGDKNVTLACRVFRDISHGIIIGNRDLRKREAVLNYERLSATLKAGDGTRINVPVSIGDMGTKFTWPKDMYAKIIRKEFIPPEGKQ